MLVVVLVAVHVPVSMLLLTVVRLPVAVHENVELINGVLLVENVEVAEVVLVPVLLAVKLVLAVIDLVAVPVWLFLLLLIVALPVAVAVREKVALLDDVLLFVFEPRDVMLVVEDDDNVKVAEVVLVRVLLAVKLVLAVIDVVAVPVWLFLLLLIVALSVAVAVRDNVALLDDVLLVVFEPPVAESSLVSVLLRDTVKLRLKLIVGDAVVVLDPLVLRVISRLTVSVLLIEDDRVGDSGDRVCDSE